MVSYRTFNICTWLECNHLSAIGSGSINLISPPIRRALHGFITGLLAMNQSYGENHSITDFDSKLRRMWKSHKKAKIQVKNMNYLEKQLQSHEAQWMHTTSLIEHNGEIKNNSNQSVV